MNDNLDMLLRSTEALGEVTLHKMDNGWWACIKLPAPVGCAAQVNSDSDCSTPTAAVEQMLERLKSLRQKFGTPEMRIAIK